MPLVIQSPTQSNRIEYLMMTLMGLMGELRILELRLSNLVWTLLLMAIFGAIWLYVCLSMNKIAGQTATFHDDGTIMITNRKGQTLHTINVCDYSGVASGWGLKSQCSCGFVVALLPKDIFAPVLIVYANNRRSTAKLPETEDVTRVRQQIADKTGLENHGFIGTMTSDDEWRLLVNYPNNRRYPK